MPPTMSAAEPSCASVILVTAEKAVREKEAKAVEKEVARTELYDAKEKPREEEVAKGKEARQIIHPSKRSVSILWILTTSSMKKRS
jgi:hypothetical protein